MSKRIDELVLALRNNPSGARFVDACKVATHYFGSPRNRGSSHYVWKMPWAGGPGINLQRAKGGGAKAYQVRQLILAIDKLTQERS